jgi:hypothetical protein
MEAKQKLETFLDELSKFNKLPRLSAAARDIDDIIDKLSGARDQIAAGESHSPLPLSSRQDMSNSPRMQPWIRTPRV